METRIRFRIDEEIKRLAQQMEKQGRTLNDACPELTEFQDGNGNSFRATFPNPGKHVLARDGFYLPVWEFRATLDKYDDLFNCSSNWRM